MVWVLREDSSTKNHVKHVTEISPLLLYWRVHSALFGLLFLTSSSSSPHFLKKGCLVCCDTLVSSQRAELSSAIETRNDTYEVSVGPKVLK